jgi:hypothetical protein
MPHPVTLIRDEVHLRIGVRKAAEEFTFANNFILEKTWKPFEYLEDLADPEQFPHGKVYVMGGRPGDLINRSRNNTAGPRDHGVMLGFQIVILNPQDDAEIDSYLSFMQELEDVCQKLVNLPPFSFSRLEYALDPEGMPLSFIMQRKAQTFEAYFTAFYTRMVPNL